MKPISFASVVAACATVVLVAGSAQAQTVTESKCHSTIAKTITKYQAGLVKSVALCHKLRNLNKAPYNALNCNDATAAANTKGLLQSTRDKNKALIVKLCETVPALKGLNADATLALYPRCPSPSKTKDDGGLTTGIDNFSELSDCLINLSEAYVSRISAEAFGLPALPVVVKGPISTCQGAIGKALGKALSNYPKTRMKCQGAQEKALGGLDYDACATNDSLGLIAAGNTALNTALTTSCNGTPATLAAMGACGQTAAQLQKCITDRLVKRVGGGLVAATYELPAGQCSAYADVLINAGYGDRLTNTELDSGYTGSGHNVDLEDDYLGGVTLSGCDADCSGCSVTLDRSPGGKKYAGYNTCRCDNDATVACTTIEGLDPACNAGASTCHCFFGPPLALSAAAAPVCVSNRFQSEFAGLTGEVGEYDVQTRTAAVVHLGISQTQPCPTCSGRCSVTTSTPCVSSASCPTGETCVGADGTDNDGTRGGTCAGGARNGLACDVNANSPDFGPTSFDCPPAAAANISGTGLKLNLVFTDDTQTVNAGISDPSLCTAGTCHCSECSFDRSVGCSSDADCAVFGAGTCGGPRVCTLDNNVSCSADIHCSSIGAGTCIRAALASKQNSCDGLACVEDDSGTNQGVCGGLTPAMLFCDGQLRGNGEGYIPCDAGGDADCRALDSECGDGSPGSCGLCGVGSGGVALRKCFLPTITATGKPGIFSSEGVASFCSASTSNAGVNAAGGLPGPGRVRLDFDFDLYCADHSTPYDLPGGSNCP